MTTKRPRLGSDYPKRITGKTKLADRPPIDPNESVAAYARRISTPRSDSRAAKAMAASDPVAKVVDAANAIPDEAFLGDLVDELERRRRARISAEAEVERLRAVEAEQSQLVIGALKKLKLEGARGATAMVTRKDKPVPKVVDWEAFYAYVRKTNAFELLHRRVTETAVAERWAAKKTVPGVEREMVVKLTVTTIAPKRDASA